MSAPEVTVIDYGVGNLLSVQRGFERCGAKVRLTANPSEILASRRVVLPGVGAFASGMQALQQLGLVDVLQELGHRQTPLLGICLGMQMLLDESEEFGITPGLGLISGRVVSMPSQSIEGQRLKLPHIGWSSLQPSHEGWEATLLQDNFTGDAAYFVHSYMAVPDDPKYRIADCVYGGHLIAATIGHEQIIGCQFHPEKSGEVGLKILKRFCVD